MMKLKNEGHGYIYGSVCEAEPYLNETDTARDPADYIKIVKPQKLPLPNAAAKLLFNSRPFFAGGLGLAAGILACYVGFCYGFVLLIAAALATAALVLLLLARFESGRGRVCSIVFAVLFACGILRAGISFFNFANCPQINSGVPVYARVQKVASYEDFAILTLDGVSFGGKKSGGVAKVYVYSSAALKKLPARYDKVCVNADFSRSVDYYEGASLGNNVVNGVYYTAALGSDDYITVTGSSLNVFEASREYVSGYLRRAVSGDNYGVVLAMLTGDTSFTEQEVLNAFRLSGIAHVFAVSGLHIGLFSSLFSVLAKAFKLSGAKKCAFVLIPTLFYAGVCGFSSSALRAFTMLSVIMLSELFGFKHDRLSALALAAVILAMINPFCIFGAGWLLSFAAVGGIILLAPPLKRGATVLGKAGESLSVTLAAQLGTLPILTNMCGYISLISTFANLLLLPLLSLLYQAFAVIAVISLPLYALGVNGGVLSAITFLPDNALSAITAALVALDAQEFAFPFTFGFSAAFYYAALVTYSDVTNLSARKKLKLITCFAAGFVFAVLIQNNLA